MSGLAGLRQRVEAATGEDRRLDCDLWLAVVAPEGLFCGLTLGEALASYPEDPGLGSYFNVPKLTASLDAVLALVGEKLPGWRKVIEETADGAWYAEVWPITGGPFQARAASAALALLSALLSALANTPTPRVAPLSASPQTSDDGPGMPPTSISKDQTP